MIEHAYCIVKEVEPGVLFCTTRGQWITRLMYLAAVFFAVGALGNLWTMFFLGVKPTMKVAAIVIGVVLISGCVSVLLFRMAQLRSQEMGAYSFNTHTRTFHGVDEEVAHNLDDVVRIWTSFDMVSPTRFDAIFTFSYWLKIEMSDGSRYRIGHGSLQELEKVTRWLQEKGIQ